MTVTHAAGRDATPKTSHGSTTPTATSGRKPDRFVKNQPISTQLPHKLGRPRASHAAWRDEKCGGCRFFGKQVEGHRYCTAPDRTRVAFIFNSMQACSKYTSKNQTDRQDQETDRSYRIRKIKTFFGIYREKLNRAIRALCVKFTDDGLFGVADNVAFKAFARLKNLYTQATIMQREQTSEDLEETCFSMRIAMDDAAIGLLNCVRLGQGTIDLATGYLEEMIRQELAGFALENSEEESAKSEKSGNQESVKSGKSVKGGNEEGGKSGNGGNNDGEDGE